MDEKTLIFLAQQGNEEAFLKLYRAYDAKIETFIYSRMNNSQDAEDIIAEIWEKILIHLKNFKGTFDDSFKSWIFTISRNRLINFYKKNRKEREKLSLDEVESLIFRDFEKKDIYESKELSGFVERLPYQQAQAIKLKYFQDYKNKEIAQKLQISEKTVASNLSRAMDKLLKMMQ